MKRNICPECKGEPLLETETGFTICGFCKGFRTVESTDESYHKERISLFNRSWIDVVRIRAIEREKSNKLEKDFRVLEKFHGTKFEGYRPYYKTLIQNDVNFS